MRRNIIAMVIQKTKSVEPACEVQHFLFYKIKIGYWKCQQNFWYFVRRGGPVMLTDNRT